MLNSVNMLDNLNKLNFEITFFLDVIVKEKTSGKKMYFLQQGLVEIRSAKTSTIKKLGDGCYFGGTVALISFVVN